MISSRALELQPSATLKITGRAKELQREGKSIISLSAVHWSNLECQMKLYNLTR